MLSPLTGSDDVTLLNTISSAKLICDWEKAYQIDIREEFKGVSEIEIWQCNVTGLLFFAPESVAGSALLYEQLQKLKGYYPPDKWEHKIALSAIAKCENVLEIGCGEGSFIRSARENGINASGIELNAEAVNIAKSNGLPVELLDLQEASSNYVNYYDAICSFQVLEHVPNPGEFLCWQLKMLKPGGKLIVCVPNQNSFIKHYFELLDYPPHHMSHWSKDTFKRLEQVFGIKLVRCLEEPLSMPHAPVYWAAYKQYACSKSPLFKVVYNRYVYSVFERGIRAGAGKWFKDQCLYTEFIKEN